MPNEMRAGRAARRRRRRHRAGRRALARDLEAVYDIPVTVSAVLGKATMQVSQLLKLGRGAVVELDRKLGEAIDIYVNNRLVARGEVVMVDDSRLGVTMTEIVKADRSAERALSMRVLIIGSLGGELGQAGAHRDRARRQAASRPTTRRRALMRGCAPTRAIDLVLCDLPPRHRRADARADAPSASPCRSSPAARDADADAAVRAIRAGAREFLPLPPDADLIAAILEAAAGETPRPDRRATRSCRPRAAAPSRSRRPRPRS